MTTTEEFKIQKRTETEVKQNYAQVCAQYGEAMYKIKLLEFECMQHAERLRLLNLEFETVKTVKKEETTK